MSVCKRADPAISSTEQVRQIMKGVQENAFHILVVKPRQLWPTSPRSASFWTRLAALEFACHRPRRRRTSFISATTFPSTPCVPSIAASCVTNLTVEMAFHQHGPLVNRNINLKYIIHQQVPAALPPHPAFTTRPPDIDVAQDQPSTRVNVHTTTIA